MTTAAERRYYALAAGTALGLALLYALTRRPGHDWGDDFAQYLQHARNILHGQPYKATGHLLNPTRLIGPEVYPPVFPLLLAPVVAVVGPLALEQLKLVGIACFGGFLLAWAWQLSYAARAEGIGPHRWPLTLLPLLLVAAACPVLWDLKDQILSDLPYLCCQEVALGTILWWGAQRARGRVPSARSITVLGVALYAVYGCRTMGFTLIGAFGLQTLWRYRRAWRQAAPEAAALAVTAALAAGQQLWLNSHDAGYGTQLRTYFTAAMVQANYHEYWRLATHYWGEAAQLPEAWYARLGWALVALLGWGWGRAWRQDPVGTPELYFVFYLTVVILWPMPQGTRFLVPLVPLALAYVWRGARAVPLAGRVLPTALAAVTVYAGLHTIAPLLGQPVPGRHDLPATERIFAWVRWQPSGTMGLFGRPRALYLYTGQPAMAMASVTDSAQLERDIAYAHARYLIMPHNGEGYRPRRARRVLTTDAMEVLVLPSSPPTP